MSKKERGSTAAVVIDFKYVNKCYSKFHALKDINLSIEEGQVASAIGPSGSGKGTLIRTVNGLERINSGTLMVTSYDLADKYMDLNKIRKNAGVVFQHFNLYDNHTVLENITLASKIVLRRPEKENHDIAMDLLKRVGLGGKASIYPRQLFGGQKQRVAIARSSAMRPKAILFDKPASVLNPEITQGVLDATRYAADQGITMVIVTHETGFARGVGDGLIFLDQERVLEDTKPEEFFEHPKTERTRQFLSRVITEKLGG